MLIQEGNSEDSRSNMNGVISVRARPCPEIIGRYNKELSEKAPARCVIDAHSRATKK